MPSPARSCMSTAGRTCREVHRPASLSSTRGEQLQRDGQRHGLAGISVGAVRFLLSGQARYITGAVLVVDGGATLVGPSRASQ
jgi:NAD(P)-dependent dehydrogenase (short-subunit alcohol dehydrogenase family)